MGFTGSQLEGTRGGHCCCGMGWQLPARSKPPGSGCRQGLPGSLLPSPDCRTAGSPSGASKNLPLPPLPRLAGGKS